MHTKRPIFYATTLLFVILAGIVLSIVDSILGLGGHATVTSQTSATGAYYGAFANRGLLANLFTLRRRRGRLSFPASSFSLQSAPSLGALEYFHDVCGLHRHTYALSGLWQIARLDPLRILPASDPRRWYPSARLGP